MLSLWHYERIVLKSELQMIVIRVTSIRVDCQANILDSYCKFEHYTFLLAHLDIITNSIQNKCFSRIVSKYARFWRICEHFKSVLRVKMSLNRYYQKF